MNHSDIWPIHGSPPISCGRCMVIWHGYSRPMTGSTPLPVFQGSVQTRIIERPSNHKRIHMHVLFWWVSTNICANIFWDLWVVNGVYTSCNPSVPLSWSTFWHDVRWNTFLTHIFRTWVLKTRYTKISTVDHHFAFYPLIKWQFWIILGMNLPVPIAYFVYTPLKRHPLMTSGAFSKCRLLAKAACRNVGLHSGMFVDLVSPSYIYSPANGGL